MDFLREKLTVTAAAPGLSETFFADLLQPRPDFDTLVAFAGWSATVQQEMIATKARKNCGGLGWSVCGPGGGVDHPALCAPAAALLCKDGGPDAGPLPREGHATGIVEQPAPAR